MIRKIRLISKFIIVTSQPGLEAIAMYTLPNISRCKGNQEIKFWSVIEHNIRNIFLEKTYTKCDGEIIPRPYSKKSKLSISLDE